MAKYIKSRIISHSLGNSSLVTFSSVIAIMTIVSVTYTGSLTMALVYVNTFKHRQGMDMIEVTSLNGDMAITGKTFLYSQAALNWIVYAVICKQFRKTVRSIVCKKKNNTVIVAAVNSTVQP
jgi:hypothetical protein